MNAVFVLASCLLAVASAEPGVLGYGASPYGAYPYGAYPYSAYPYSSYAAPVAAYAAPIAHTVTNQYHAQDELGQYSYGYSGGPSAKTETRTADGITRGGYSYVDSNGIVQTTNYVADPINGFRVAATNLPVAPAPVLAAGPLPVGDTVEVAAAKAAHFEAHAVARAGVVVGHPIALATEARQIDPVAIAAGAPLPTGDTVEVAAAKAAHFHAHAAATAGHLRYKRGLAYASPIGYAAYAPRSFGYSSVTAHHTPLAYSGYAAPLAYSGYATPYTVPLASEARQIDPVAIAAGAPLPTGDTVEVAAAKAAHLNIHAAETVRNYGLHAYAPHLAYSHVAPVAYAHHAIAPIALASEARQIDPVAIAAGAPLPTGDTVEVAAAKAAHFHEHAKVRGFVY